MFAGSHLLPLQKRLFDFAKLGPIHASGGSATAVFELGPSALAMADATGSSVSLPGEYSLMFNTGGIGEVDEIVVPLTVTGTRRVVWTLPPGV